MDFCHLYKLNPHSEADGLSFHFKVEHFILYLYQAEYKFSSIRGILSGTKDCLVRYGYIKHKDQFYSERIARLLKGIENVQTENDEILDSSQKIEFTFALLIDLRKIMRESLRDEDFDVSFAMVCFNCALSLRCTSGLVTSVRGATSWPARPENLTFTFNHGQNISMKSVWQLKPGDNPSGIELRLKEKNDKQGSAIRSAGAHADSSINLVQIIADSLTKYPPIHGDAIFSGTPDAARFNGQYYLKIIRLCLKLMANRLSVPPNLFNTHIFRNFAAHQLAAAGYSCEDIMRQTGHKSPTSIKPYLTPSATTHGHRVAAALHGMHSSSAHTIANFVARRNMPFRKRHGAAKATSKAPKKASNARARHELVAAGKLKRRITKPVFQLNTHSASTTRSILNQYATRSASR